MRFTYTFHFFFFIIVCVNIYIKLHKWNLGTYIANSETKTKEIKALKSSSQKEEYCAPQKLPYDYDNAGFVLSCPCTTKLPENITKVHLFYHVGMVRNWKDIVKDQLQTLDSCGLGTLASSLTITYTNGDKLDIEEVLSSYSFVKKLDKLRIIPGPTKNPWEIFAMNAMHNTCQDISINASNAAVIYFHNKGASHYTDDWRDKTTTVWSYVYALRWRKYMEYFLLERPSLCLTALSHGATSCGVELHDEPGIHYSGNFWTATCDFIQELPPFDGELEGSAAAKYLAAEFWLENGVRKEIAKYAGLYDTPKHLLMEVLEPKDYMFDEVVPIEVIEKYVAKIIMEKGFKEKRLNNITKPFVFGVG